MRSKSRLHPGNAGFVIFSQLSPSAMLPNDHARRHTRALNTGLAVMDRWIDHDPAAPVRPHLAFAQEYTTAVAGGLTARQCQSAAPAEADAPDRHGDGGLGGFDDRDLDRRFEFVTIAGHAAAAHDEHVGAVLVAQSAAGLDHPCQGRVRICEFENA
jgi:hypothetical protein